MLRVRGLRDWNFVTSVMTVLLYIEKSPVTTHKKTPSQQMNSAWPSLVALVVKKKTCLPMQEM